MSITGRVPPAPFKATHAPLCSCPSCAPASFPSVLHCSCFVLSRMFYKQSPQCVTSGWACSFQRRSPVTEPWRHHVFTTHGRVASAQGGIRPPQHPPRAGWRACVPEGLPCWGRGRGRGRGGRGFFSSPQRQLVPSGSGWDSMTPTATGAQPGWGTSQSSPPCGVPLQWDEA